MSAAAASRSGSFGPDDPVGLRAEGLTVDLGGVRLLHEVDLAVDPGGWVCVLGPNGAGKSTLLRALAGLTPHGGRIVLAGRDAGRLRHRERARLVAMVAQTPVVPAGMTVLDYLLLGRTPHLATFVNEGIHDHEVTDEVMGRLDLHPFRERALASLSGGERQRVVLGRALVQATPILLLDEPTTALDIGHQQEVLDLVDELRHERGLAVISTMHDLTLAGQYADRLVLLADGSVRADGPAPEVLREDVLEALYGAAVRVVHDRDGIAVLPLRAGRAAGPR